MPHWYIMRWGFNSKELLSKRVSPGFDGMLERFTGSQRPPLSPILDLALPRKIGPLPVTPEQLTKGLPA